MQGHILLIGLFCYYPSSPEPLSRTCLAVCLVSSFRPSLSRSPWLWGPKSEFICLLWPRRVSMNLLLRRLEEKALELKFGGRWDLEKLRGSFCSTWVRPEAFRRGRGRMGECALREGASGQNSCPKLQDAAISPARFSASCFGVAVPRLPSPQPSCLFIPQRSSLSSPRLHSWSRWRLWCPCWTALISKVPLHYSA